MPRYRIEENVYQNGVRIWEIDAPNAEVAEEMYNEGTIVETRMDADIESDGDIGEATQIGGAAPTPAPATPAPTGSTVPPATAQGMFVRVIQKGKVIPVMISNGGSAREAMQAAGIKTAKRFTVTGVPFVETPGYGTTTLCTSNNLEGG